MQDKNELVLFCDGACRGNPGPSSAGAALFLKNESDPIETISKALGHATNNEAEYNSLILGLEAAKKAEGSSIKIFMDSELVVKQIRGQYKVKKEHLRPLHSRAKKLLDSFPSWEINHIERAKNSLADSLANKALDG